ncbi:MAG: nucleotidyltransferase domain-containing protein [Campylobacterota bacterium]|nr:nucleotidyltransferase domain-containing protein [Campylobacterota bacterium]
MMYGLHQDELDTIVNTLKPFNIQKIILFGSRAKGNYKRGSDVDLAISGDERKASYMLNEETNLPYFFDVVNMDKINNKNLLEHIRRVGKVL